MNIIVSYVAVFVLLSLLVIPVLRIFFVKNEVLKKVKRDNLSIKTELTAAPELIKFVGYVSVSPFITPIDDDVKRFIYPDKSFSLEIPAESNVNVNLRRFSSGEDLIGSVGLEWNKKEDPNPHRISFVSGGRGGPNFDEYFYEKFFVNGEVVVRKSYYLNERMIETLYWIEDGWFSDEVLMIDFTKANFKKGDDFSEVDNIVKSFMRML